MSELYTLDSEKEKRIFEELRRLGLSDKEIAKEVVDHFLGLRFDEIDALEGIPRPDVFVGSLTVSKLIRKGYLRAEDVADHTDDRLLSFLISLSTQTYSDTVRDLLNTLFHYDRDHKFKKRVSRLVKNWFYEFLEKCITGHCYVHPDILESYIFFPHEDKRSVLRKVLGMLRHTNLNHPYVAELVSSLLKASYAKIEDLEDTVQEFSAAVHPSAYKYLISLLYEHAKHYPSKRETVSKMVEELMKKIYSYRFRREPPQPSHHPLLPDVIEHPEFRGGPGERKREKVELPHHLSERLRELGIHNVELHNIHGVIDLLENHRDIVLQHAENREEVERTIEEVLRELRSLARKISTSRVILDFRLERTPKDPLEWVGCRVRASGDCTVPNTAPPGFEEHTVPFFFSEGETYKIVGTHLDYDNRRGRRRLRLRGNRHVGNVYLSVLERGDGGKILYLHGIQLGPLYRGKENAHIGRKILRGLIDIARKQGFDELWVQLDDLSNYRELEEKVREGKRSLILVWSE